MTFREYYKEIRKKKRPPHPANEFLSNIAHLTGRSESTVRQWTVGNQIPDYATCNLISEFTGISAKELFPEMRDVCADVSIGICI